MAQRGTKRWAFTVQKVEAKLQVPGDQKRLSIIAKGV